MSRIDDVARGLALRSPRGPDVDGIRADAADLPLERIARALAAPMSRRRALRLAAAAAGTSLFTLKTERAYGCQSCPQPNDPSHWTQFCGHARGVGCLYVCCPPEFTCCQTEKGVVCCKVGYGCGPVVDDLPTCSCKQPCGTECCLDDEDCVITDPADGQGYCAPKCRSNEIRCFEGRQCCPYEMDCCGEGCCDPSHSCCGDFATTEFQTCCPPGYGCSGGNFPRCECLGVQECGDRCCPGGQVCFSAEDRDCRGPQMEDLDDLLDFLRQSLSGAGAASGGSAGAARTLAAAPGAGDALVAVGAVANLAALAHDRFRSSHPDSAYRRPVKVPRPKLAPIAPGPGLDPAAAQALQKLLSVEARAWALVNAAAVARARSLGAIRARNARAARAQARASGRFAGQAAKALRKLPALRASAVDAMRLGGTPEVTRTSSEVRALQDAVRASGLPADMRARLTQLGLGRADQKRVVKIILATRPQSGPVLIAPLADASRLSAIAALADRFARVATSVRKRPIVSSKPGPSTIRGSRPHSAGSTRRRSGTPS